MELKKVLTTQEFAKALKCSPKTVRKNHCITGACYGVVPLKIGARLLWPVAEVTKLLNGKVAV